MNKNEPPKMDWRATRLTTANFVHTLTVRKRKEVFDANILFFPHEDNTTTITIEPCRTELEYAVV